MTQLAEVWWNATNLFADLPLHEYVISRRAQVQGFCLSPHKPDAESCLVFTSANQLLRVSECAALDGRLWVYDLKSQAFQLAQDTSVCLDIFGAHAGSNFGTYWCHGGVNQRFRRQAGDGRAEPTPGGGAFCALGSFCVWPIAPSKAAVESKPNGRTAPY